MRVDRSEEPPFAESAKDGAPLRIIDLVELTDSMDGRTEARVERRRLCFRLNEWQQGCRTPRLRYTDGR